MDLKYRGTAYRIQPLSLGKPKQQPIGTYRGQNCYRNVYDLSQVKQSHPLLQYRGVAYGGANPVQVTPKIEQIQQNSFKIQVPDSQKPIRSSRHHQLSELDQVHNQFLLQKLEQRIAAARRKGDRDLMQLLESEKNQLQ
ncbi:MAG: DUF4278 domain-containing protein [Cyanobacteria bacterium P01_F01_bin.42]